MTSGTVYHYYSRYLEHPSGVTDSINHWVAATAEAGLPVAIIAATPQRDTPGNEFADQQRTRTIAHLGRNRTSWVPVGLVKLLHKNDILVLHEGWVLSNIVAALIARLKRVAYIVVPHGVYEQGILDETRDVAGLRKRAERSLLRHSFAVHVFYPGERAVVRNFVRGVNRFLTHPNGAPDPADRVRWIGDGDYFLWIGRFDPHHKGLDHLVDFWSHLPEPRPRLILAGPDFRSGRETIRRLVHDRRLDASVEFRGRVSGAEKVELMVHARAYVHPSRWESCSIMLLEMLAAGAPSLISHTIHAADELEPVGVLLSTNFGRYTPEGAERLREVDANAELGARAVRWADERGSWAAVGPAYAAELKTIRNEEKTS